MNNLEYGHKPFFYKRYIDDGFGIWDGDLKSLKDFQEYANKIHENIKIQLRWSRNQVEFLDTLVKLDNGHIYTDLYVKPTDKQLYLKLVRTPLNVYFTAFKSSFLSLYAHINSDECHAWFHLNAASPAVRNAEQVNITKNSYLW